MKVRWLMIEMNPIEITSEKENCVNYERSSSANEYKSHNTALQCV